ncbi:carboxypeptidase-like regulatory domain-containing protein [Salicola sp. Rm-C-2C1-2]|uniref:carboxypeptidase-like regulatory domain-containing protein n=1 Tax=Salicola sp. Rm-C-2C1-2 TaxID=3141321 RepID=UPI0032E41E41
MVNPSVDSKQVTAIVLVMATALLSACGGGGSSSGSGAGDNPDNDSSSISGIVTDPPISGAAVFLRSSNGEALSTVERTDQDGEFTLSYGRGADLAGATVEARGGTDTETGLDFTGMTLAAPLEEGEARVVSPLTSLVVAGSEATNLGIEAARSAVADRLGLSEGQLRANPADAPAVQRASLLVSRSALAIGVQDGGMERFAQALRKNGDPVSAVAALESDQSLSEAARGRLGTLKPELEAISDLDESSSEALLEAANRIAVRNAVSDFLSDRLSVGGDSETQSNVTAFADAVWKANERRGIASRSSQIANVVRYALGGYGISAADFSDSDFSVPAGLADDSLVAQLAGVEVLDPDVPLAEGEELGSDNTARLEYLLSSRESPLYQAERLFDDVVDDGVLDPVFGDIAQGVARAGLFDRAETVVDTRIFQAEERARTFRRLGAAVAEFDRTEQAEAFFDAGLDEYQAIIDSIGIKNLREQDAEFYQGMSRRLREAGLSERVDDALEPVERFIEVNAGKPFSAAYARIAIALQEGAEEAVEEAEAAGLTPGAVNEALSAVNLFYEAAKGQGEQGIPDGKFLLRALYISEAAQLYARLDARAQGLDAIKAYEDLITAGDTNRASTYVRYVASAYGQFGEIQRFQDFLTNVIEPIDADDAEQGRTQLAIFQAIEDARSGQVAEGVERVKSQHNEVLDQIESLTYRGEGSRDVGLRFLARQLFDRGLESEALEVADAAWELASSEELAADDSIGINEYVSDGCRKVARLYEWLDAPEQARSRMQQCWKLARDRASGSGDRATAAQLSAFGYLWVGLDDQIDPVVDTLYSEASGLSDPGERHSKLMTVAKLRAEAGDTVRANQVLDESVDLLSQIGTTGSSEDAIKAALTDAASTAERYILAANEGRRGIAENGSLAPEQRSAITRARNSAEAVITGGEDVPGSGSWEGYLALSDALASPSDRATRDATAVDCLADARAFEQAKELARSAMDRPERERRLQAIAESYTSRDDYPGTDLATYDYDGDGSPDFFSPASSQAERSESPLMLDSDIDGDGVPATSDRTPYCAECGGA